MKNLLLISFPYESSIGGLEIKWKEICEELKNDFSISIISNGDTLSKILSQNNFQTKSFHSPIGPIAKKGLFDVIFKYKKFKKEIEEYIYKNYSKDTTIILFQPLEKLLLTKPLKLKGYKIIWTEDVTIRTKQYIFNPIIRLLFPYLSKFTNYIITPSKKEEEVMQKWKWKNTLTINNFVNDKFFDVKQNKFNTKIAYIGRLDGKKGEYILLKAIKQTNKAIDIIGDGPERKKIELFVKNNHINANFLGFQNTIEIIKDYKTICIPTTKPESFGNTIAEGMASEKNVITSELSGISIIIDKKNGWVCKSNNINSLVQCINESFIKDKGKEAKKTALKEFKKDIIIKNLKNLFS